MRLEKFTFSDMQKPHQICVRKVQNPINRYVRKPQYFYGHGKENTYAPHLLLRPRINRRAEP